MGQGSENQICEAKTQQQKANKNQANSEHAQQEKIWKGGNIKLTQTQHWSRREPGVRNYPEQAGIRDKPSLPWCGGAFLQGGGSVGSIGEGTLRGHDQ